MSVVSQAVKAAPEGVKVLAESVAAVAPSPPNATIKVVKSPAATPTVASAAAQKDMATLAREMASASCAVTTITALLNPIDALKVRIQTEGQLTLEPTARVYRGVRNGMYTVWSQEGILGMWRPGLGASCMRDVVNGGIRIGLYPTIRDNLPTWAAPKITAGLLTGAVGSFIANPCDIVKIRMQGEAGVVGPEGKYMTGLFQGARPAYRNAVQGVYTIACEGPTEIWRGVTPSMTRAALVTCGQMSGYSYAKEGLTKLGQKEGSLMHLQAGLIAGMCATLLSCPADVIKSRFMNDRKNSSVKARLYSSPLDCVKKTVGAEGPFALYRGWWPAYLRLGPHSAMCLPLMEIIRTNVFGLKNV